MDKRIVLAKAGSGKTYHICNIIDPTKRNLILAFTNENIHNLISEVEKANNGIRPEKTVITTFHSFLYHTFIRPYESIYSEYFGVPEFSSHGVEVFSTPEPQRIKGRYNYKYQNKDKVGHYYTKNKKFIYVSRMSELPFEVNNKKNNLLKLAIAYLNHFYDYIYIDEVQDFRRFDWKILLSVIKGVNRVQLVGDFYQHSVSGMNNSGVPFSNHSTYSKYVSYLKGLNISVDESTLSNSRRCPASVCNHVMLKTSVDISSHADCDNQGDVYYISNTDLIIQILEDNTIKKLVWEESKKYNFNVINWSYSKGDTYNKTCLILTKVLSKEYFKDDFRVKEGVSRNKLYVALTRTKGDLYIITSDDFNTALLKAPYLIK